MRVRLEVPIGAFLVAASAAMVSAQGSGTTRTRHGDTVVVSITGNGTWGAPHDAVEVKRISADTKETTFGTVYELKATPDGGVVLVDTKSLDGLIVRQLNADGKFVRNLGRKGNGPGEYSRGVQSLAVHPNGTVLLRDSDKSVSRFGADGTLLSSFSLFQTNGSTNEVIAATDGSIYLRAAFLNGDSPTEGPGIQRPMMHYDTTGRVLDSLVERSRWLPPETNDTYAPHQWWSLMPDGRRLFTRSDKVGFLIADAAHKSPPLIVERTGATVQYLKEEREELQAVQIFRQQYCQIPGQSPRTAQTIPQTKRALRGATIDLDGRIWVMVSAVGQKTTPRVSAICGDRTGDHSITTAYVDAPVYDVFQPDGTFLGEVRFPVGARVTFAGNTAWAIVPDGDDVPVLVKYRIH